MTSPSPSAQNADNFQAPADAWKAPGDFEQSIHARFEQLAAIHPERIAVASAAWQPTFKQLEHAARRIAHALLATPGSRGDRVLLLARHDAPLFVAVLAALKAAKIAVVLNPTDPPARLARVILDADPRVVLADIEHLNVVQSLGSVAPKVIGIESHLAGSSTPSPAVEILPGDAAFLVYTSGSTAAPKGVIRSHRSILHNTYRHGCGFKIQPDDRLLLLASLSGGSGVSTAFTALLHGATLCPFPIQELGVTNLACWMQARGITIYSSSSSVFRHFMRTIPAHEQFSQVRSVRLSGEPATPADVTAFEQHFPKHCDLLHTLSSSETGNIARLRLSECHFAKEGRLPVGRATEDVELLLLDEQGQPVAPGEVGEIAARSKYLASGYWRDEALTTAKFSVSGEWTTFHSGDRGRINSDGLLEFVGRKDGRVKIRGYRIEPAEIETALRQHPGVAEVVVCERLRANGDAHLVAFVTRRGTQPATPTELRAALRSVLPQHMIPADFVVLSRLPLTSTGKLDRASLREMPLPSIAGPIGAQPASDTERLLASIWNRLFSRKSICRDDDFFALGGDSLVAAVVAANLHAELGVEIPLSTFNAHPTLAALAAAVDRTPRLERVLPLPTVSRTAPLPLSFAQEMIWKICQSPEGLASYIMASSFRIRGELNVNLLRQCLHEMVDRHEILRTTFNMRRSTPVALVHARAMSDMTVLDFSQHADPEGDVRKFLRERTSDVQFDLRRLPLLRWWLIRIGARENWLLRRHHHIISDSLSWKIYFNELTEIYESRIHNRSCRLLPAPQYGDYAAWQRSTLRENSRSLRCNIDWWKEQFLSPPPPLELPFTRRIPCPTATPGDAVVSWEIDANVSRRLDQIAAQNHTTHFVVRLAVFAAALGEATQLSDLVLGIYATCRNRLDLQNMFGMFANMLTLRLRWNQEHSFTDWLNYVAQRVTEIQAYAQLPYQLLCEKLWQAASPPPEIRAIFSVSDHLAPRYFGGLELTRIERRIESMPWGFSMKLDQHNEHRCYTEFDARIYEPTGVRSFVHRYLDLLDLVSAHTHTPLSAMMRMRPSRESTLRCERSTLSRDAA